MTRPKMTMHRGRTWDCGTVILHDGSTRQAFLDTSWGTQFYFSDDAGDWYAGSIDRYQVVENHALLFDLRQPHPMAKQVS